MSTPLNDVEQNLLVKVIQHVGDIDRDKDIKFAVSMVLRTVQCAKVRKDYLSRVLFAAARAEIRKQQFAVLKGKVLERLGNGRVTQSTVATLVRSIPTSEPRRHYLYKRLCKLAHT